MFKRVDNQDMIQQKLSDGNIKRYIKGRLLGKGGFAKCYEVISLQTQKKYAAKIIQKASLEKSKAKEKLTSEIKIHKSLNHPYVVHFEHYFEDAQFVYILLQKCPNQTLNELLKRRKRLTDTETKYYIRQLAVAIKYIHEQQIIHRDLKLGNLFLSEKLEIKIGDFGLATKLTHQGERKKTKCGTPNYIAPEILDDKKTHSFQVDIWSMGVIAYALLVGKPPFQTSDVKNTYNKIKTCSYNFPDSAGVTDLAKNFISKMLQLDPCKRSTVDEVLADPFLCQSSIPNLLPMSSLACPPSYDFLKKYKDAENQQNKNPVNKKSIESLQKSQISQIQEEQKKFSSDNIMSQEKNMVKKPASRVNSIQKLLKSANRVFSAANLLGNTTKSNNNTKKKQKSLACKSVKIWINYFTQNPKFGMAYLLNSNAIGFRYNDSTVMISNSVMTKVKYLQYDPVAKKLKQGDAKLYDPIQAQKAEQSKFKILAHFHRSLVDMKQKSENLMPNEARIKIEEAKWREDVSSTMKCYVIRYHPTSKCVIFWLSINAIQVIFQDSTELLINGNGVITYVNKYKDRFYFEEKDKQLQSQQIRKRLNYFNSTAKNVLLKKGEVTDQENENNCVRKEEKNNENKKEGSSMSRCNSGKLGSLQGAINSQTTTRQLKTSSSITNLGKSKKLETKQIN